MSDALIIAVLSLAGTITLAVLGWIVAELVRLNQRLRRSEHRDRLSWLYIRALVDHAYRHGAIPLPEPPEGWLDGPEE